MCGGRVGGEKINVDVNIHVFRSRMALRGMSRCVCCNTYSLRDVTVVYVSLACFPRRTVSPVPSTIVAVAVVISGERIISDRCEIGLK